MASADPSSTTPIKNLRITFWGVQGSCPTSPTAGELEQMLACRQPAGRLAPAVPFYGGETTCIEVETSEGNVLLFDLGTGVRRCSQSIVERWKDRRDRTLHIFGSHEHLDHRMGLTFARFCYVQQEPFTVHVYGPRGFLNALDQHYGLFSRRIGEVTYMDDPVDYSAMAASFHGVELCPRGELPQPRPWPWPAQDIEQPIRIGATTISAFEAYHGATRCIAYRVEHGGKRFVFSTDHELRRGADPGSADPRQARSMAAEQRLVEHCRNADLAYFDGQYLLEEYLGKKGVGSSPPMSRVDWGHGCVEDIVERAERANIRRSIIGHHDPERTWQERLKIDQRLAELCRDKPWRVELARGEAVVDL